jgi:hypothetical protein
MLTTPLSLLAVPAHSFENYASSGRPTSQGGAIFTMPQWTFHIGQLQNLRPSDRTQCFTCVSRST